MASDDPGRSNPGKYANYLKISMNPFEMVMDFGEYYVEDASPAIHTRIVTTPPFFRTFSDLLRESLRELEAKKDPGADR
jgi:hypothetical protein